MPAAQGGLAQMLAQQGGSREIVKAAAEIENTPGGQELLYTHFAEELMKAQGMPGKEAKKLRLFKLGGSVAQAAEKTRKAGRGSDSMMLHMTPEEYEAITAMWGKPDINPNTGIGEYGFLGDLWKGLKSGVKKVVKSKAFQVVAPMALTMFAPGLGTAVGSALTGGGSGAAANIVGNAVVGGGLGALSGGKKGAATGAVAGGLTAAVSGYRKGLGEDAGLEGKAAEVVGDALVDSGAEGDVVGGLGAMSPDQGLAPLPELGGEAVMSDPVTAHLEGIQATPAPSAGAPPPQGPPAPAQAPAPERDLMGLAAKYALPGITALGALTSGGGGDEEPPSWAGQQAEGFNDPLPVFDMNRQFKGLQNQSDYYTYGQAGSPQSGQHLFTDPDPFPGDTSPLAAAAGATGPQPVQLPPGRAGMAERRSLEAQGWTYDPESNSMTPPQQAAGQARGGYQEGGEFDYWEQNEDVFNEAPAVSREGGHHVRGPGSGRSDDIPAYLSDGEYVIDAESVALLGDGSGSAGAKRLDEMRKELRMHKAGKMKKGEFTHKAKKPSAYMNKVNKLRRTAKYEHGGSHNVGGTSPVPPVGPAVGGNA